MDDPNYTHAMIRTLFKRVIEEVPPVERERLWYSRFINLWQLYIVFEEYETRDLERVSRLYSRILDLIPHERFSFEVIWISAAKFEIDRSNFQKAVTILESAMEKAATNHIFRMYVDLKIELDEGEEPDINKCRTLFENLDNNDSIAWLIYIKFERFFCSPDRVRFTFKMLLYRPQFYKCEQLWQLYIKFELSVGEFDTGRHFFEEFLQHKKDTRIIWFYYTKFVASIAALLFEREQFEDEVRKSKGKKIDYYEVYVELVRKLFQRGIRHFKKSKNPDCELFLLDASKRVEQNFEILGIINSAPSRTSSPQRRNRCTLTLI